MAKRDQYNQPHKFYVYYDKRSGEIFSVTNSISDRYEHAIEVPYETIKGFMEENYHFKDYKVDYERQEDGTTKLGIVSNLNHGQYDFKNNVFEWIIESDQPAECIVEWNSPLQSWNFSLSDRFKSQYNEQLTSSTIMFFVTLETDFDFLIREIPIEFDQLLVNTVSVPFSSELEKSIDKISISTKLIFKNYKLVKTYE